MPLPSTPNLARNASSIAASSFRNWVWKPRPLTQAILFSSPIDPANEKLHFWQARADHKETKIAPLDVQCMAICHCHLFYVLAVDLAGRGAAHLRCVMPC